MYVYLIVYVYLYMCICTDVYLYLCVIYINDKCLLVEANKFQALRIHVDIIFGYVPCVYMYNIIFGYVPCVYMYCIVPSWRRYFIYALANASVAHLDMPMT